MAITLTLERAKVQVNSDPLWTDTGQVNAWVEGVGRELYGWSVKYCPPNRTSSRKYDFLRKGQSTGILLASIRQQTARVGDRKIWAAVSAGAPHAKYVLEGTVNQGRSGYIYTTKGFFNKGLIDSWIDDGIFEFGKGESGLVMWLPPAPGLESLSGLIPGTRHQNNLFMRVRGQKANPFLTDAYTEVQRRHAALPSKRFKRTLL